MNPGPTVENTRQSWAKVRAGSERIVEPAQRSAQSLGRSTGLRVCCSRHLFIEIPCVMSWCWLPRIRARESQEQHDAKDRAITRHAKGQRPVRVDDAGYGRWVDESMDCAPPSPAQSHDHSRGGGGRERRQQRPRCKAYSKEETFLHIGANDPKRPRNSVEQRRTG